MNTHLRHYHKVWLLVLSVTAAYGQITGDITGTVIDPSGAAVPNAKITLTSNETGAVRAVEADEEGRFRFSLLSIGAYQVKAEAPAFRVSVAEAMVRSGEITTVRFSLEVGQVTESVVVTDAVSLLDTANAQVQISIEGAKIQDIPVNRDPNLFATIAPGVVPVTDNNPFLGTGSYNANGSRGRANNITVDNITATDISVTGTGGPLGPLNFTQIKEVKLITNNFSAEYGRNSGSQLQYITKSGTNEFHGEAYEYLQNDKLNARPFFDRTGKANIVRQNQYGGVLGGPAIKNKLFFFGSVEWFKLRGAGAARIAQVPTAAMLGQVTDPTSRALLQQYQLPAAETITPTFGTVQQQASNLTDQRQWSVRVDYQIGQKDRVTARYADFINDESSSGLTFISTNIANFGAKATNQPKNTNASWTRIFSPTIVNDFNFGYGKSNPDFPITSTVPLGPRIQFLNGQIDRFGLWEGLGQGRAQKTFQFLDTLSWVKGAHTFKFGVDIFHYRADSYFDALQRPLVSFNNWDDFAAGRPFSVSQRFGSSVRENRVNNQFFFVQDDWRVRSNLTLNLGVRMERAEGPTEANGIISNLDLACNTSPGAAGTGPFGCFAVGRPSFNSSWNWGPRIGLAWNPFGDQKTVIRGGYGIAYDFIYLNPITNQRFLPPFIITGSLQGLPTFTGDNSWANLVAGTSQLQRETVAQVGQVSGTVLNFGNVNPAIDFGLRNPQTQQWSLELQREVAQGAVLKARYLGTKSNFLQRSRMINTIADPRFRPATSVADETARLTDFVAINAAAAGGATRPSNRIDPRYNEILLVDSSANSNFHSFQFEAQKRFANGVFLQSSYTWGKSIDDISDALGVLINDSSLQQNPYSNRDNRAVSQFDVRHRFVLVHLWEPTWGSGIGNGFLRALVHGWGFSGISSFRSGFPVSFESGTRRGIGNLSLIGYGAAPVRVNASGPFDFDPQPFGAAGSPNGLNTDVQPISTYAASLGLSQPLLGNFGSLGRNTHRLNGQKNFDWNVYKNFAVTEGVSIQIRAEFYNTFNNVSFQDVTRNIANPGFGQYTTVAQNARTMQVGARIKF